MSGLCKVYDWFFGLFAYLKSPLVLLMRLYWGWHFFLAGRGKFMNIDQTIEFFQKVGTPSPENLVYIVATIELVGGLALLIGFGSRFFAFLLTSVMCGAYATAHVKSLEQLLTDPSMFISEAPFLYLVTSLVVLIGGPGYFAIDTFIRSRLSPKD